ncbi:MAG: DUF3300 domain-containing protein, partial [Betaproteobacteria bacterium]|nr:DUF3300 domain-containing protein [Betaproteobacteria bacterium]
MNTWFFSSSRAGCLGVLAAAGLILMVSPALALNIYPVDTMDTPSVSPVSSNPAISQEKLDGLLAPIALYPDALLAQVLMASTYPVDVMEAARWQQENPNLSDQALQDALASFDWDPSVKSLVTVPQVLQHMAKSPRWMQSLGRVVIDDQEWVMVSVQELRKKAHAAGTLTSNEQQTVGVEADAASGVEYVTIAPASPQVVYVPVYDPYVVYGGWWWPSRPYYWGPSYGITFSSGYYWGSHYYPSMALWGGFNWGLGAMIINVPIYRSYYRASPPSRPHNVWHPSPTYRRSVGAPSYRYYRPAAQRSGVVGSAAPSSSAV